VREPQFDLLDQVIGDLASRTRDQDLEGLGRDDGRGRVWTHLFNRFAVSNRGGQGTTRVTE